MAMNPQWSLEPDDGWEAEQTQELGDVLQDDPLDLREAAARDQATTREIKGEDEQGLDVVPEIVQRVAQAWDRDLLRPAFNDADLRWGKRASFESFRRKLFGAERKPSADARRALAALLLEAVNLLTARRDGCSWPRGTPEEWLRDCPPDRIPLKKMIEAARPSWSARLAELSRQSLEIVDAAYAPILDFPESAELLVDFWPLKQFHELGPATSACSMTYELAESVLVDSRRREWLDPETAAWDRRARDGSSARRVMQERRDFLLGLWEPERGLVDYFQAMLVLAESQRLASTPDRRLTPRNRSAWLKKYENLARLFTELADKHGLSVGFLACCNAIRSQEAYAKYEKLFRQGKLHSRPGQYETIDVIKKLIKQAQDGWPFWREVAVRTWPETSVGHPVYRIKLSECQSCLQEDAGLAGPELRIADRGSAGHQLQPYYCGLFDRADWARQIVRSEVKSWYRRWYQLMPARWTSLTSRTADEREQRAWWEELRSWLASGRDGPPELRIDPDEALALAEELRERYEQLGIAERFGIAITSFEMEATGRQYPRDPGKRARETEEQKRQIVRSELMASIDRFPRLPDDEAEEEDEGEEMVEGAHEAIPPVSDPRRVVSLRDPGYESLVELVTRLRELGIVDPDRNRPVDRDGLQQCGRFIEGTLGAAAGESRGWHDLSRTVFEAAGNLVGKAARAEFSEEVLRPLQLILSGLSIQIRESEGFREIPLADISRRPRP